MDEIKIGTTGDYPPFSKKINNSFTGIDIDLAHIIGNQLNLKVVFVETTWSNLHEDFKNNKFDIAISGIAINEEREKFALFSTPYVYSGKTAIGLKTNINNINNINKINNPNINVIVNKGGTNEKFTDKHFHKANIIKKESNTNIFDFIVNGEADIMFTDSIEAEYVEFHEPLLSRSMPEKLYDPFQIAIMIKKKSMQNKINIILNELIKNKKIKEIIQYNFKLK